MKAYERFLKYVSVWTTSDENSETVPSADRELVLAKLLAEEMKELGIADARVDEKGYVYGSVPATPGCEKAPALGLIAHMDTAPDAPGDNIHPQIIENYDGKDVVLGTSGKMIKVEEFPYLADLKGRTLITTDGPTLLGADDKAGIAEILTAVSMLQEQNIPHGKVCIGFTPDEEIGLGPSHFDIENFGAEYAYTMDGGDPACVSYENFHACAATFEIKGYSIHPGSSKNRMINAALVGCEINSMLPTGETPRDSEGREGFYHLTGMQGETEQAELHYIIRDHDRAKFEDRKAVMQKVCAEIDRRYGAGTVELTLRDSYYNMKEKIEPCLFLIENAKQAMEQLGIEPKVVPIRGGTDGARLSFEGLPCPNLCTGGENFHGRFEYIPAEDMERITQLLAVMLWNLAE